LKLGPGDLRSHSADEFIYLNEIEEGIDLYIKILSDFLSIKIIWSYFPLSVAIFFFLKKKIKRIFTVIRAKLSAPKKKI
jgi:hypothetical protein